MFLWMLFPRGHGARSCSCGCSSQGAMELGRVPVDALPKGPWSQVVFLWMLFPRGHGARSCSCGCSSQGAMELGRVPVDALPKGPWS